MVNEFLSLQLSSYLVWLRIVQDSFTMENHIVTTLGLKFHALILEYSCGVEIKHLLKRIDGVVLGRDCFHLYPFDNDRYQYFQLMPQVWTHIEIRVD